MQGILKDFSLVEKEAKPLKGQDVRVTGGIAFGRDSDQR